MALNIAELIIFGLIVDWLFRKCKVPGLVGMLLVGIVLGPYVLGLLRPGLLNASSDFRMIALIVILLRAGFELSKDTLHKVGMRAILLSFIPAVMEGVAVMFLGRAFLGLSMMEAAILGAVLSAVSPAVVVPLMIRFIEERRGTKKGIPTLVLAASSIDDVFVIVVYSVLIGMYTGQKVNIAWKLMGIPISIASGIAVGLLCGFILYRLFEAFNPRATKRLLIILGISILLVQLEHVLDNFWPFAALLAVMAIGFIILEKSEYMAHEISSKLGKLWVFAEIALFTLVGSQVNLGVALKAGLYGSLLIFLALIARSIGTYLCLIKSNFTMSERIFIVISYIPKATVQAAIGGAPLMAMAAAGMNTQPGEVILAVAVLSILLTAPVGAWAISIYGRRVLAVEPLEIAHPVETEKVAEGELARCLKVSDVMEKDIVLVKEKEKLSKVIGCFSDYDFLVCPVVDHSNKLTGVVRLENVRAVLNKQHAWNLLVAYDVVSPLKQNLYSNSSLEDGLQVARDGGIEQVPVLDSKSDKVVGIFDSRRGKEYLKRELVKLEYGGN